MSFHMESEYSGVKHFEVVPYENSKFRCALCQKCFSDKNCLKKHIKKIHNVKPELLLQNNDDSKNKITLYKCRVCETEFAYKRNLKRHLIKYHSQGLDDEECGNCFCNFEGCKFRSFFVNALRTHLSDDHNIPMDVENKVFSSEKEFEEWKENEEKSNVCLFIKEAGRHTLMNGDQRLIFQCHRSGHYSGQGFGKRSFREKGTCKIGKRCTAGIELTVKANNDAHDVVYYKTHIWHKPDVTHVNLSTSERVFLANKLKEGVSIASILESVNADKNNDCTTLCTRIQLLKRKDLVNIENTFRLNNTERHIKKQHKKGLKFESDKIKKNLNNYGEVVSWVIESPGKESEYFTVQRLQLEKCIPPCGVLCSMCDICLHMYSCTCHDYLLFDTMCQHIHSVCLSLNSAVNNKNQLSNSSDINGKRKADSKLKNKNPEQHVVNYKTMAMADHNDSEMIEGLSRNSDLQREQGLLEEKNKLRQKIHVVGELCLAKLNHMNENSIRTVMKIFDSAVEIFNGVELVDQAASAPTTQTETVLDVVDHMQPRMITTTPMSASVAYLENMHDESVIKYRSDNLFYASPLENRKYDTFPQYCSASRSKRRKLDEPTVASSTITTCRSHNFDKRNIYGNNLNDNTLINDNYSLFDCNGMTWQLPALSTANSNIQVKWWTP